MKGLIVLATILLAFLWVVSPVAAANPDQVKQLIAGRACVGCDLREVDLRGVNLTKVNLRNADLRGANLMATTFQQADLRGANLSNALLLGTNFVGANLKNAKVNVAKLRSARLCRTIGLNRKVADRDC